MKKMPTALAETIYGLLTRYAEAHPDYHQRESFIYHFGVCSHTQPEYKLTCLDGASRSFFCFDDGMFLRGKGEGKVNSILRKILEEKSEEFGDFTVKRREYSPSTAE